jgi:hypothetical protein
MSTPTAPRRRLVGLGWSSEPMIRFWDTFDIEPCDGAALEVGDLVAFRFGLILACHRIIDSRTRAGVLEVLTKGDSCTLPDDWIAASELVGRVVAIGRVELQGSKRLRALSRLLGWHARWQYRLLTGLVRSRPALARSRALHALLFPWRLARRPGVGREAERQWLALFDAIGRRLWQRHSSCDSPSEERRYAP